MNTPSETTLSTDKIWTPADEAAFVAVASPQLKLAFYLATWTGQRLGDLLPLEWHAYDGDTLRIRRRLDDRLISIPVSAELKDILDASKPIRQGPTILALKDGKAWTIAGFSFVWRRTMAKAGLTNLSFHDLRRSAFQRLSDQGFSALEISKVLGLDVKLLRGILTANTSSRPAGIDDSAVKHAEREKFPTKRPTADENGPRH